MLFLHWSALSVPIPVIITFYLSDNLLDSRSFQYFSIEQANIEF